MMAWLRESEGIENLELDALGDGVEWISDAEEDARVARRLHLEFQIEDEVAILALSVYIGVETLPARLARARL